MRNKLLLCLVLVCLVTKYSECKGGRGSSRSSSSSSSSRGGGWFSRSRSKPSSSSSSGHSYPSSSSGLSGSGSSSYKYPSSFGSSSSFKLPTFSYPSSSSGLSGWGSGSNKQPSVSYPSSTGLSGSGGNTFPSLSGFGSSGGFKLPTFSYPSSTGLSGSGSGSNKQPSISYPSSTGLSGWGGNTFPSLSGSGSSGGFKLPTFNYPSSTGLSGSGSGNNKQPSISYPSSTGLSGSGGNSFPSLSGFGSSGGLKSPTFNYPSSTGLSGSGSGSNKYPTTGLSGSGSRNSYPNNYYPTSNANSRPSNPYHSTNAYNTNSGNTYKTPSYSYGTHNTHYNPPTYYSAPQHVYITEYRQSGSRYSDLLTGLALYNLGRSHNHIPDSYYYDDYYRRRYHSSGSSYSSNDKLKDEARCMLRIKQNGKIEELNIPCEIVSTFTDGSQKLSQDTVTQTVCVTNYTVINNTLPLTTTIEPVNMSVPDNYSSSTQSSILPKDSINAAENASISSTTMTIMLSNSTILSNSMLQQNITGISNNTIFNSTASSLTDSNNITNVSLPLDKVIPLTPNATTFQNTLHPLITNISTIPLIESNQTFVKTSTNNTQKTIITSQIMTMNTTNCTITNNPLSVKGPPIKASGLECEIDIVTKESHFRNKVDCKTLLEYAKMPEPKKESSNSILPSRSKLKSWISNPPWWLSMLIAV